MGRICYLCTVFRKRHDILKAQLSVESAPRRIKEQIISTLKYAHYSADFTIVDIGQCRA